MGLRDYLNKKLDQYPAKTWDSEKVNSLFESVYDDDTDVGDKALHGLWALANHGEREAVEALWVARTYSTMHLHPSLIDLADRILDDLGEDLNSEKSPKEWICYREAVTK
jgi:hypothetical protein